MDPEVYDYTIFHALMEECPDAYRESLYRLMRFYIQSISEAKEKEDS